MKEYIFIKTKGETYIKVKLEDILYIKSLKDYSEVHLKDKRYVISVSLKNIAERLNNNFYRCGREYIVNLNNIDYIKDLNIYCSEKIIRLSKELKIEILNKLNYTGTNAGLKKRKIYNKEIA